MMVVEAAAFVEELALGDGAVDTDVLPLVDEPEQPAAPTATMPAARTVGIDRANADVVAPERIVGILTLKL